MERKEPAHAMEQSCERTYRIWGITESWFDYIEEKVYFFLTYNCKGKILTIQLDNHIIKNVNFYVINTTIETVLPKEY